LLSVQRLFESDENLLIIVIPCNLIFSLLNMIFDRAIIIQTLLGHWSVLNLFCILLKLFLNQSFVTLRILMFWELGIYVVPKNISFRYLFSGVFVGSIHRRGRGSCLLSVDVVEAIISLFTDIIKGLFDQLRYLIHSFWFLRDWLMSFERAYYRHIQN
jgi:hypothetical protein